MIYLVSSQMSLFDEADLPYARMAAEDALSMILSWDVVEYDSETSGSLKLKFV